MHRTKIQIKFNEIWYQANEWRNNKKYIRIYENIKNVLKVYVLKKELEEEDQEIYRDLPDAFDAARVFLFLFDSVSLSLPSSLSFYAPKGACVIRRIEKHRVGIKQESLSKK